MSESRVFSPKYRAAMCTALSIAISSCSTVRQPDKPISHLTTPKENFNEHDPYERFLEIDRDETVVHDIPKLPDYPTIPQTTIIADKSIAINKDAVARLLAYFNLMGQSEITLSGASTTNGEDIEMQLKPYSNPLKKSTFGVFKEDNDAKIWGGHHPYGQGYVEAQQEYFSYVRLPTSQSSPDNDLLRTYLIIERLCLSQLEAHGSISGGSFDSQYWTSLACGSISFAEAAKIHGLDFDTYTYYISNGVGTTAKAENGSLTSAFSVNEDFYDEMPAFKHPIKVFLFDMRSQKNIDPNIAAISSRSQSTQRKRPEDKRFVQL